MRDAHRESACRANHHPVATRSVAKQSDARGASGHASQSPAPPSCSIHSADSLPRDSRPESKHGGIVVAAARSGEDLDAVEGLVDRAGDMPERAVGSVSEPGEEGSQPQTMIALVSARVRRSASCHAPGVSSSLLPPRLRTRFFASRRAV